MPQGTSKEAPRSPRGSPKTPLRQLEDGVRSHKTKFWTEFPSKLVKLAKSKKTLRFPLFFRLQKPPNGARQFEEGLTKAPRRPPGSPETARRWCPKSRNDFLKQLTAQTCQTCEKQNNVTFSIVFELAEAPKCRKAPRWKPQDRPEGALRHP